MVAILFSKWSQMISTMRISGIITVAMSTGLQKRVSLFMTLIIQTMAMDIGDMIVIGDSAIMNGDHTDTILAWSTSKRIMTPLMKKSTKKNLAMPMLIMMTIIMDLTHGIKNMILSMNTPMSSCTTVTLQNISKVSTIPTLKVVHTITATAHIMAWDQLEVMGTLITWNPHGMNQEWTGKVTMISMLLITQMTLTLSKHANHLNLKVRLKSQNKLLRRKKRRRSQRKRNQLLLQPQLQSLNQRKRHQRRLSLLRNRRREERRRKKKTIYGPTDTSTTPSTIILHILTHITIQLVITWIMDMNGVVNITVNGMNQNIMEIGTNPRIMEIGTNLSTMANGMNPTMENMKHLMITIILGNITTTRAAIAMPTTIMNHLSSTSRISSTE